MSRAVVTARVTGCDVSKAKVLVVGAGGIGCELIKNLVLTGFTDVLMIDLDTIDYSNLNRQFLFRQHHVGQPKCKAARDAALEFPHDANLTIAAQQANIKGEDFDRQFWKGFDIVLSALDNVDARKHVNQECLIANVPLVESGTQGTEGQVHAILRGKTSCFMCHPPPPPKTYPVCTVRNHPDKPVHCIHWVKELLFPKLFGGMETDLIDTQEGAGNDGAAEGEAEGQGDLAGEAPAPAVSTSVPSDVPAPPQPSSLVREPGEVAFAFARRVFRAVFEEDIERLVRMEVLWKERAPPTPMRLRDMAGEAGGLEVSMGSEGSPTALPDAAKLREAGDSPESRAWTVAESTAIFLDTVTTVLEKRAKEVGSMSFDKDDSDALDFMTAASNLRMACFGIGMLSRWNVKEVAGNIIPAIATTNAIIAGFIVLEACKILRGKSAECCFCWCSAALRGKRRDLRLMGTKLDPPKPKCDVCSWPLLSLTLNLNTFSVFRLVTEVVKGSLGLAKPSIIHASDRQQDGKYIQLQLCDGILDPDDLDEEDEEDAARYASYLPMALASQDLPMPCRDGAELIITDEASEDLGLLGDTMFGCAVRVKIYLRHDPLEAAFQISDPLLEEAKERIAAAAAVRKKAAQEARAEEEAAAKAATEEAAVSNKRQRIDLDDGDDVCVLD